MCDGDVVMEFCDVYVAVKTLVEEHQAVKNKTLIAPGKLCTLMMMAVSLVACTLCNVMEVKQAARKKIGRGILYARDGRNLPHKRSCQMKSSSEKAIWEGAGQGQLLHFSKYEDIQDL